MVLKTNISEKERQAICLLQQTIDAFKVVVELYKAKTATLKPTSALRKDLEGLIPYWTGKGALLTQCNPEHPQPCKECGKYGHDVTLEADPYASEIHNDDTLVWMCESCRHDSAMEI